MLISNHKIATRPGGDFVVCTGKVENTGNFVMVEFLGNRCYNKKYDEPKQKGALEWIKSFITPM